MRKGRREGQREKNIRKDREKAMTRGKGRRGELKSRGKRIQEKT